MRFTFSLLVLLGFASPADAQWKSCVLESWATFLSPGQQQFEAVETFQSGRGTVTAIRFGPLAGTHGKIFLFLLGATNCGEAAVAIGSYEGTTQAARLSGDIGADERIYHADLYEPDRHVTLGFYRAAPDYETSRSLALKALSGP